MKILAGWKRSLTTLAFCAASMASLGAHAEDQLAKVKQASRWYLIGSDYVWPWLSHRATKKYIAGAGGRVVGEEFVRIGEHDHSAHIARIRAAKPDVVLISLIGTDSIVFNRAFAEQGLATRMLRLGGAMDETVLLGIGADPHRRGLTELAGQREQLTGDLLHVAVGVLGEDENFSHD